jgi:hypothetical protein
LGKRPIERTVVTVVEVSDEEAVLGHPTNDVGEEGCTINQLDERNLKQHKLARRKQIRGTLENLDLCSLDIYLQDNRTGHTELLDGVVEAKYRNHT